MQTISFKNNRPSSIHYKVKHPRSNTVKSRMFTSPGIEGILTRGPVRALCEALDHAHLVAEQYGYAEVYKWDTVSNNWIEIAWMY